MTAKEIVESLKTFSMMEVSDLVACLEKEFGISSNFNVAGPANSEKAVETKSEVDIHLSSIGENKIGTIKVIREVTGLGLMDAKKMADSTPALVKAAVSISEAEEIKKKFMEIGAVIDLK